MHSMHVQVGVLAVSRADLPSTTRLATRSAGLVLDRSLHIISISISIAIVIVIDTFIVVVVIVTIVVFFGG